MKDGGVQVISLATLYSGDGQRVVEGNNPQLSDEWKTPGIGLAQLFLWELALEVF